jgi:hypothetical protein
MMYTKNEQKKNVRNQGLEMTEWNATAIGRSLHKRTGGELYESEPKALTKDHISRMYPTW